MEADEQFAVAVTVEDADWVVQGVVFMGVGWTEANVGPVVQKVKLVFVVVEVLVQPWHVEKVAFHTVWEHAVFEVVEPWHVEPVAFHSVWHVVPVAFHSVWHVVPVVAFESVWVHAVFELVVASDKVWAVFVTSKVIPGSSWNVTAHQGVVLERVGHVAVESWVVGADGFHCKI